MLNTYDRRRLLGERLRNAIRASAKYVNENFGLCPCCGLPVNGVSADFEICPICGWQDDGQSDADVNVVRGGPNGRLSLADARSRFDNLLGAFKTECASQLPYKTKLEELRALLCTLPSDPNFELDHIVVDSYLAMILRLEDFPQRR